MTGSLPLSGEARVRKTGMYRWLEGGRDGRERTTDGGEVSK